MKIREGGNNIVLDAHLNEHSVEGKLSRALKHIGLMKTFYRRFKTSGATSYDKGSIQIDGVWSTCEILPNCVSLLPHRFGAGDHRLILVDFYINDLLESMMKTCIHSMRS